MRVEVVRAAVLVAAWLPAVARAADAPALPSAPRFEITASPIGLRGDVRPQQYLGVVGPRSAWLGAETGEAELWVHPLKLASGFRLDFRIPDYAEPVRGRDVARSVEVRPEATTITYSHSAFTVRQHILAPLDEPGLLVLLEVDASRLLEVVASFRSVLQYAWPGGLGGQYAFWSDEDKAFVLSESLRRRNALIGSPWAVSATSHPAHALPDAPSRFTIPIDPARAARELVPIGIVAATAPRAEVAAAYRRLVSRAREIYDARVGHARRLREEALRIDSPDDRLDLALEWAKVNLDEQTVCNPDLGCGLVAGWGPSGDGARPGFGWFFGGDAAINSLAMAAIGQWAPAWDGLRFLAKYQRADGKVPHEVSQAAAVIPWFDEYPYAYYHADTTPYFLLALHRLWQASGDGRRVALRHRFPGTRPLPVRAALGRLRARRRARAARLRLGARPPPGAVLGRPLSSARHGRASAVLRDLDAGEPDRLRATGPFARRPGRARPPRAAAAAGVGPAAGLRPRRGPEPARRRFRAAAFRDADRARPEWFGACTRAAADAAAGCPRSHRPPRRPSGLRKPLRSVGLSGSRRVVDIRWAGGLEVEAPRAALEPGQPDQGVRVIDVAGLDGSFRLSLEGPSGATATLRLHGERPLGADSGTLRWSRGATELEVTFPSSQARFSRAEIRLRRP